MRLQDSTAQVYGLWKRQWKRPTAPHKCRQKHLPEFHSAREHLRTFQVTARNNGNSFSAQQAIYPRHKMACHLR